MNTNPSKTVQQVSPLESLIAISLIGLLGLSPDLLWGAPTGQNVAQGQASFTQQGNTTIIQAGNNAIINYQSFNIQANETVQFIQPSADSRVLNRVLGNVPTSILGNLLANGQVYIVNPAGIYFGNGSHINVGGLVAAGGNLSDADFLSDNNHFTGVNGNVENYGTIAANSVVLAGQQVVNSGVIDAAGGVVTMLSGNDILIGQSDGHVFINLGTANPGNSTGVNNTGTIDADGGQALLAAGDLYSLAVMNSGTVNANHITLEGTGSGVVQASGTLNASAPTPGGLGGQIEVLGQDVNLIGANVDASGGAAGGTILIGGGLHGTDPNINNSQRTYVSSDSQIHADALEQGNGGEVVVWSDAATGDFGTITARGGSLGGNGGLVETSSKLYLDVTKAPDVSAPHGIAGTWLIDPSNITITNGGGGNLDPSTPDFIANADNSVVDSSVIDAALNLNENVIISTANPNGTQTGDIFSLVAIQKSTAGTASLTMLAGDSITINAPISSVGGPLNVTLTALDPNQPPLVGTAPQGIVNIAAPITTSGGYFQSSGATTTLNAGITTSGQDIIINGKVSVNSTGVTLSTGPTSGNIHIEGIVDNPQPNSGGLTLDAGGEIIIDGNIGGIYSLSSLDLEAKTIFLGGPQCNASSIMLDTGSVVPNSGLATVIASAPGGISFGGGGKGNLQYFKMGQNVKMVATDGNLYVNVTGPYTLPIVGAVLGDLGASGNITVNAPTITLQDRLPTPGVPGDNGLDFVAQAITFVGTPQFSYGGAGNQTMAFATLNGLVSVNGVAGNIFPLANTSFYKLTLVPFIGRTSSGAVLDPVANAPAPQLAGALGLVAPIPQAESAEVNLQDLIALAELEDLKNLGIYARPATQAELTQSLLGEGLYVQPVIHERPNPEEYQVVDRRMSQIAVTRALDTYHEIIPAGQPPAVTEQLKLKLKQAVNDAYASYIDKTKHAEDDASGFWAYLEDGSRSGDTTAKNVLTDLQDFRKLFGQIDELGLTAVEVENARHYLLRLIEIPSVLPVDLEQVIEPPRPDIKDNVAMAR